MSTVKDTCDHLSELKEPRGVEVHKEECTQCFDSDTSEAGLNLCLTCFNGGCAGIKKHYQRHFAVSKHPIVLNIKKFEVEEEESEPAPKITKLAIGGEGGIQLEKPVKFDYLKKVMCLTCDAEISLKNTVIANIVDKVFQADSAIKPQEVSLTEERKTCDHIEKLVQLPDPPKIQPKATATCSSCTLKEDLWLCMTCGALGCPRSIHPMLGGGGGNDHAENHWKKTGHPCVLKTGTISPEGTADVQCYACEKMVIDKKLADHCSHFGLKLSEQERTSKTMAEKDLELNLNMDWSRAVEGDKEVTLVYGGGKTGLVNLGNSCYLSSIFQVLFSLPPFQRRYFVEGKNHLTECRNNRPGSCYQCQMAKLAEGLLGGRYSQPPSPEDLELHLKLREEKKGGKPATDVKSEKTKKLKDLQPGIAPHMVRKLLLADSQFNNKKQQDAFEFAQWLLDAVRVKELKGVDPTTGFNFNTETRLECTVCHQVRYKSTKTSDLPLLIPLDEKKEKKGDKDKDKKETKEKEAKEKEKPAEAAEPCPLVASGQKCPFDNELHYQTYAHGTSAAASSTSTSTTQSKDKKDEEPEEEPVEFVKCLDNWIAPTLVENWTCTHCEKPTTAKQTTKFETLPDVLMVQLQRFVQADWSLKKLSVPIVTEPELDLGKYKGKGLQAGEKELPMSQKEKAAATATLKPNEEWVMQLTSMGFTHPACVRACLAVKNSSLDDAMQWIFSHMEDPGINNELTPAELGGTTTTAAPAATGGGSDVPADKIAQLESMGFGADRAKYALTKTSNNVERALDWLMSHMDDDIPTETAPAKPADTPKETKKVADTGPTTYRLVGVVTHLGKSTNSGHYVAHLLKEGKWILFNDAKVSLSDPSSLRGGYLYFFRRAGK